MLFEKVVTTQPLISYDNASQICIIGGVIIFITLISMIVDEFNPISLAVLLFGSFIVFFGVYGYSLKEDKVND